MERDQLASAISFEVLRACAEAHRQIFRADALDLFDNAILAANCRTSERVISKSL